MAQPLQLLGMTSDFVVWQAALLTVVSFAVGILGGFVGLALGTMRLPALLLMGMEAPTAGGTNILVSGVSSLAGAIRHLRDGRVNMRIVLVMGVPASVGAFVGAFGSDRVPEALLVVLAGLLVFWQGLELVARARRNRTGPGHQWRDSESHRETSAIWSANRLAVEGGIGLAVGLLGGAVGLILGSLRLPALIRILRMDPRIAAGTNLFIGFIMGSVGWVGDVVRGQVDYPLLALMGGAAMIGSYYGATLTGRATMNALIRTMGCVLLAAGASLVWLAFRMS